MKKLIFLLLFLLVLLPIISAETYDNCEIYGNCEEGLEIEEGGNYTINVNNSDLWGGYAWSDIRWLEIDGSNANQDVDIGAYDFYADDGIFDGVNSRFNYSLLIDGDIANDNAYLTIDSESNMYSCINLTEGGGLGFSICNDGSGVNRFVISNYDTGFEYFEIDRDDGTITFNNNTIINGNITADYFIGSGAELDDLNVTGVLNVTGDFTGYAINISFLYGAEGVGGMDLRGDPWWLGGVDLQIAENLLVDGNLTLGQEITFAFNEVIDNIVNGWIRITGNLNVTGDTYIDGDLNVTGKIHNSLTHVHGLATAVHSVASGGVWYNITFNASLMDVNGMDFEDNRTFIVQDSGHYTITFGMGIVDSAASPDAHVGMRVTLNGIELVGSYVEEDTHKKDTDDWLEHITHVHLITGDSLNLQYISDDTTVTIEQQDTYARQGFSAYVYIQGIIV